MKATFLTENLQKCLSFTNHAVSANNQLEILSTFLITAEKGRLVIKATDLEIGISSSIPANVEENGSACVPAKTFFDLVNNMSEEKISIETQGQNLVLKGKKIKMAFQTMPFEDFPNLYEDKGEEVVVLKKETVLEDFGKVVFAASQDSGRPALSGVLIKKQKTGFLMVATDGYRLSLKNNVVIKTKGKDGVLELLLSARVIRELASIKQEGDISLFVSNRNNQAVFIQGETVLVGRLIEAEYPSYEKIIPADLGTKAEFDKDEMQKAIKLCSVFARETANIVKLSVKKDKVVVSANTPSVGENTVEVDARVTGEENEIAFNARYLLDLFANVEDESMSFEMAGPLNPGVFKITSDNSFLHLIMPIRVQG
ncbi:MAG: DNA polymerase III subunit beta [Patescibacteria group bacterium]|nr:DNA polymerase III subunit beta [Patescibacteria group bacterium]